MKIPISLAITLCAIATVLPAQGLLRPVGERSISIGVSISRSSCRLAFPEFQFATPPMIAKVGEGSIGDKAGLMVRDTLLAIDGESITTNTGAGFFGAWVPGRQQRWTIKRVGKRLMVPLLIPEDA